MTIDFLREVFREHATEQAVVTPERTWSFRELLDAIDATQREFGAAGIVLGSVVSLEADYAPGSIAALLALFEMGAIVVPIAPASEARRERFLAIAGVEHRVRFAPGGSLQVLRGGPRLEHPLYRKLREAGHGGLVLFTSGYTGEPKAALHDVTRLLRKYHTRRHKTRTLLLLLFDHIGGFDTLLQSLSNGGAVIVPADRTPEAVSQAIERHKAEVLPASPSLLTLLLLSGAHQRHDLSSLRFITYGAEVMPQATLTRLAEEFPGVTLLQKYGLTELGTLRSQSKARDSLWVRVGGEGYQLRVREGKLEILAESSMLGYLNAPSPFTEDGWFITGDAVEVEGGYFRILGRESDLINVGGQKVYPAEVESVVAEVANVREVAVLGVPHPFTGQIVVARVVLERPEEARAVEARVREFCRDRLAPYMVPARVEVVAGPLHTDRSKLLRREGA